MVLIDNRMKTEKKKKRNRIKAGGVGYRKTAFRRHAGKVSGTGKPGL